jgi:hypothetical protein
MSDPDEKYLAAKSVKVPFRTPQPNEKAVLDAIRRFAENYKKTLADNREVLLYQDIVDYDKLLAGSQYADGGIMAKGGVIASSETKEGIEKLISDYYYSSNISLKKVDNKDEYEVSNSKGKINGVKVIVKKGRYQFVNSDKMAMGGTFAEGVKAIEKRLVGTKVNPKFQKEYGKTYDKAEANEAATKIKGKIRAMELAKKYKKKK